jgi:hypothetical protein
MMPGVPAVQLLVSRAAVAASIAFRDHHMEGLPGCPHSWDAGTKQLLRSSAEAVIVALDTHCYRIPAPVRRHS